MHALQAACEELKLDGLVVIGGNRTHTDAAYLSEHFQALGVKTCVVGAPCSISGGMRNQFVEAAVGYDTAVKVSADCLRVAAAVSCERLCIASSFCSKQTAKMRCEFVLQMCYPMWLSPV
jgi:diphosphate-dependent phosphofructokinase